MSTHPCDVGCSCTAVFTHQKVTGFWTTRARRLHIGNLPQGVGLDAQMLKQFFNAALVSASLHDTSKEGDPVLDSMLGSESKFGFVEFRTIAEATSCLALNNIELGERKKGMQHLKPEPMS